MIGKGGTFGEGGGKPATIEEATEAESAAKVDEGTEVDTSLRGGVQHLGCHPLRASPGLASQR